MKSNICELLTISPFFAFFRLFSPFLMYKKVIICTICPFYILTHEKGQNYIPFIITYSYKNIQYKSIYNGQI